MGEARHADVVVEVELQTVEERLGGVLLALIGETLGALAQIGVEDALEAHLPLRCELGAFALGNGLDIGREYLEELGEIG